MGPITAAILIAAQASPPPPMVFQNEQQLSRFFEGLPCFEFRGAKHCVLSIIVSGKKKEMDTARRKLAAEGWPSAYRADPLGKTVLHVDPKNKTLDEAWTLTNRFSSREFGLLNAEFFTLPATGAK